IGETGGWRARLQPLEVVLPPSAFCPPGSGRGGLSRFQGILLSLAQSCCCSRPFLRDLIQRAPVALECRLLPRQALPPLHDDIDVFRIQLEAVADALGYLRGGERRPAAEEWVVNEFATPEVVQDWASHQINRLLRRVIEFVFVRAAHNEFW